LLSNTNPSSQLSISVADLHFAILVAASELALSIAPHNLQMKLTPSAVLTYPLKQVLTVEAAI